MKFKKEKTKKLRLSIKETSWESELLTHVPRGALEAVALDV